MNRIVPFVLALCFSISLYADDKIRVACVGDSITFGAAIKDRANKAYPAQLGKLLGDKYEVRNFGVNGRTMLSKGDNPWKKHKAYQNSIAFNPNIVVIKLGTNDTKPQNWKHSAEFAADTKAMVEEFKALPSKPTVYLCRPVPVYQTRWGINEKDLTEGVIPNVNKIAKETGCTVIDLYGALSDKPEMFPDKIHPNAKGAAVIAETVKKAIAE